MKKFALLAVAAASALAATAASAQPYGYYGRGDYDRRYYDRDYRDGYRDGYQNRRWSRGGYLPPAYRGRGYVVNDYGRYRLRQPPRGYYWYRSGNDYVLAAIATGLILEVFAGNNNYHRGYYDRGYYGRGW